ncbi:MAG: hypothetical protein E7552_04625 [Ruminococcaceae bacterium]|nr:hypothetical protein [Oscillospiraceae bacterium]
MKKRVLAIFLCVCLLVPFMATAAGQVVAEDGEKEYIIRELKGRVSAVLDLGSVTGANGGLLITSPDFDFDPVNVSGEEGAYKFEDVAIQFDTYIQGTESFIDYMMSGKLRGQLEATSSGMCDKEELGIAPGNALKFKAGEWCRVTVRLADFYKSNPAVDGEFDKTNFNFSRIYLEGGGDSYVGATGTLKIVNWCVVDLSAEAPTEQERPLGDGTFRADPPVFEKMTISQGYDDRIDVFAGYNMKTYLEDHPEIDVEGVEGEDYAPVINSLLEGLGANGGGALFIPAGVWECRSEINMPVGTTIVGEWVNPDENPDIRGTILAVYCGANVANGSPFITMDHHSKINNMAFWYPEQTADAKILYPPTVDMYQYTFVENVTFVNSYFAIQQQRGANCPNAWNIYGTPLNVGIDFDMVVDIARIQEIHFSADYWISSGLEGAPSTAEEIEALEMQLYDYAIGITLRRIDWSYVTYSDIDGYNIGLMFAESIEGNYPNGQCVGLTFTNCKYGHFSYGTAGSTESMLDITMKDCEYGVYVTGEEDGAIRYYDSNIHATKYAVYQESAYTKLTVMASTVRGRAYTKNGNNTFINNKFINAQPNVELDYGTIAGILIGNVDAYGEPIVYANPGACTCSYVEDPVDLKPYTEMTREEAYGKVPAPTGENYLIPNDIDITGEEDATEKIQEYLTELKALGGGTLFLVPGKYRIDGTLSVPTGVELRGSADFGSIPKAVNTMFFVYTDIEEGEGIDQYNSTATVTLEENSGIRGIIFHYPEQNQNYTPTEKVLDPVETEKMGEDVYVQYYEFEFIEYPYAIRGAGSDVYVVNVSVRNGWNGIDLITNRCDNHYVDYLSGHFFNRGIVIGNGSENGYIRNFQFNYNSIQQALSEVWSGFGGTVSNREILSAFHQPMQAQFNNNSIILQMGHVENQLVYNCFNYASYIGVHLIAEETGAADARIFGHGVDYGNVSLKIEAAENVEFTNMQLTAFNQCGDNGNTDRWAVNQEEKPIYDIWLTDTFEGEVTVTNFVEWAPTPTSGVRVDNGTLNMYNAQFSHTKSHLFELNGEGELNIIGFCCDREDNPLLVDDDPENLHITAGFYYSDPATTENVGTFEHVYMRKTRYSVPKNVLFTEDSEIVYVESFDTYELTATSDFTVDNLKYGSIRRGAVRARLNANDMMQSIKAGQNQYAEKPFALESGKANDLYRMEWRVTIDEMRDTEDSEIYLYLTNENVRIQNVMTIKRDGSVYDQNGTRIGQIEIGTYYRFAVEVDARNADSKTVTVYLLNDDSRVIGKGSTIKLSANFQGENTVTGFQLASMAMFGEGIGTETDMSLDYFYIIRSEKSTIGRNVAEGDLQIGDADGSGTVDSTDARLVLQYAVQKISALPAAEVADVDGSGTVDSTDARLILQYAVKKITSFPAA